MQPIVRQINEIEQEYQQLTEEQLRAKTDEFRRRLADGQTFDDILPEAFAAVKNACRRLVAREWTILANPYRWFMIPFDVQLIGGMVLHRGAVAEMDTGEGKTLAATMPAYLNALTGRGVHIVTVNDYLALRDREWMGPIYEMLGLTVGAIQAEMDSHQRQPEYAADITYGTNNEFGFDYLRDNMKPSKDVQVQRELHYAIVDEADSILIDEARTPLIISGPAYETTDKFYTADKVVRRLRPGKHFEVKEKEHTCHLSEEGILEAQQLLKVDDFYTGSNMDWPHLLDQALKAHYLFHRDKEYILREGRACIVDEHTGRLMPDRTWSDGLHQAIEAKEHLKIREENQTLATITLQNYFRLYDKAAGMTGTAMTEAAEFWHIYKMDVVTIPTNRPSGRVNHPDRIFLTEPEKYEAVVNEIVRAHQTGRPLLVGTISIENSEKLSGMLKRRGVKHDVLNAKQHRREAEIVKGAGEFGRVTIATNMAGRGTDIVLGPDLGATAKLPADEFREEYPDVEREALEHLREMQTKSDGHDGDGEYRGLVAELGGLYVVGTERHEARRIDNQLRGRCGRQGDPGDSRFFVSLEDDLMRVFAGDWVRAFLAKLGMGQGQAIDSPMVSRQIAKAQKRVEERNFGWRKNVLEYDMVMDEQRRIIYGQRQDILEGKDLHGMVRDMLEEVVETNVPLYIDDALPPQERDFKGLANWANSKFALQLSPGEVTDKNSDGLTDMLTERVRRLLDEREKALGPEQMRSLERYLLLQIIDVKWKDHLHAMDQLRSGIALRAYAQKDPKVEYKLEAYEMFQAMIDSIKEEVASLVLRVQIAEDYESRAADIWQVSDVVHSEVQQFEASPMAEAAETSMASETPKPFVRPGRKIGRNDPCPCGSGKKYKKCCGANK
ncbi:MAG: preprotein translocase subunit SecA [Planctomycetes bacterium SM23_65]|nr:MAG: preprotein translocase subunit SecA [Planctomycetes bacterium SM23_65]